MLKSLCVKLKEAAFSVFPVTSIVFLLNLFTPLFNYTRAEMTVFLIASALMILSIQPEKEMLMIILDKSKRDDVLHALYKSVGLQTEAQGMIISLPIEQIAGITPKSSKKERKTDDDPPVKQQ